MNYTAHETLEFRRKVFKLVGAEIDITDPVKDELVSFISMKAWKLREDIRVYTDKSKTEQVLHIKARNVFDLAGTYDVFGGDTETARFSLRRKGLRSTFVRDHWLVKAADDKPLGEMIETSGVLALFRRWIGIIPIIGELIDLALAFAPQSYRLVNADGKLLATILRRKNPFVVKLQLSTAGAEAKPVDQFMGPALCALISVLEEDK